MKSTKNLLGSLFFAALFVSMSVLPTSAFAENSHNAHGQEERAAHANAHALTASVHIESHHEDVDDEDSSNEHGQEMSDRDEDDHIHVIATTTPPTIPATPAAPAAPALPLVNSITAVRGASTSTISWTTDAPATGTVYYGATTPLVLGASTTQSAATTSLSTTHSITLSNLIASSTYAFMVQSTNAAGTAISGQFSLAANSVVGFMNYLFGTIGQTITI